MEEEAFLDFWVEFSKFNPARKATEGLVATLISHWNNTPEFRAKYKDVIQRLWDSEGVKKTFTGPGGLNPNYLFATTDNEFPVWAHLLAKTKYFPYPGRAVLEARARYQAIITRSLEDSDAKAS